MPPWPLSPGASTDEHKPAALADHLGLYEQGYRHIACDPVQLAASDACQILHVAITGMLGYHPRIESDTIEQLERMTRRSNEVERTHTDDKAVDLNDVRRKARDDMIELDTAL